MDKHNAPRHPSVSDDYPPSRPGIKTFLAIAAVVVLIALGLMGVFG